MDDNGDLKTQKEKAQDPNLGKAETVNLGSAGNLPPKEKGEPPVPPVDFKVAEIWIRNGRIMIDAPQEFWNDRARARGLLLYCDDIVRDAKMEQPKITPVRGGIRNFARKMFRK